MNKRFLSVISTKNPSDILLKNINNIKLFYPEFDILVVDSCSENRNTLDLLPEDVLIIGDNKNYELGAWIKALRQYPDYEQYMFLQDTVVPDKRIPNGFDINKFYSFHYEASISQGGYFDRLQTVYQNTDLHFISELNPNYKFILSAFSSFVGNADVCKKIIFPLETAYEMKELTKSKIDSWLSERTIGLMASHFCLDRINMDGFLKIAGGRI